MFSLTIGAGQCLLAFLFKTEEKAREAQSIANLKTSDDTDMIGIEDDFGQEGQFRVNAIYVALFEDLSKSLGAHVERGLNQARVQIEVNRYVQADPKFRMAMGNGPITTFGPVPR